MPGQEGELAVCRDKLSEELMGKITPVGKFENGHSTPVTGRDHLFTYIDIGIIVERNRSNLFHFKCYFKSFHGFVQSIAHIKIEIFF